MSDDNNNKDNEIKELSEKVISLAQKNSALVSHMTRQTLGIDIDLISEQIDNETDINRQLMISRLITTCLVASYGMFVEKIFTDKEGTAKALLSLDETRKELDKVFNNGGKSDGIKTKH